VDAPPGRASALDEVDDGACSVSLNSANTGTLPPTRSAASRSAPSTRSSGPSSRRANTARNDALGAALSGSATRVMTLDRGFDSMFRERTATAMTTGVPSGSCARHASRTTTGSPRNDMETESAASPLTRRVSRTSSVDESRGSKSAIASSARGTAEPGDNPSDHVDWEPGSDLSIVAARAHLHPVDAPGFMMVRGVRSSCVDYLHRHAMARHRIANKENGVEPFG
jgi:hypothetical protein